MDMVSPLRVIVAFGFVLALIGLCALALRTYLNKNPGFASMRRRVGRLQIVETKMLDARRKLVLVKRDAQEHLLLLTPNGDVLVEKIEGKDV